MTDGKLEFVFSYPNAVTGLSSMANLVYVIGMIASRTVQVTRTLSTHPDGRAENVSEHSHMLSLIGATLADEYFPLLDSGLVAKYANVHDLVEAYVGDTPAYDLSVNDLQAKAEREDAGLRQLSYEYSTTAPSFVGLVRDYDAQQDPESRFVRMLDKLLTVCSQFPNGGIVSKEFCGKRSVHEQMIHAQIARHMKKYPDQKVILDLYKELATFLEDMIWPEANPEKHVCAPEPHPEVKDVRL